MLGYTGRMSNLHLDLMSLAISVCMGMCSCSFSLNMYLYVCTYAHVLVSMETNEIFARRSFIITLAHRYYLF